MSPFFFCGCGMGGSETAIEIQFLNPQKFKTDKIIRIAGILQLNADDVEHFNYILTNCKGRRVN